MEIPASWRRLVRVSSALNILKWILVRLGSGGLLLAAVALFALKLRQSSHQGKRDV